MKTTKPDERFFDSTRGRVVGLRVRESCQRGGKSPGCRFDISESE